MACGFQARADYGLSACANPVRFQRVGHVRGSGRQRRKRIAELRKRQVNTSVCEWETPIPGVSICSSIIRRNGLEGRRPTAAQKNALGNAMISITVNGKAGEITIKDGRVEQGNFDAYQVVRLADTPKIEVYLALSG